MGKALLLCNAGLQVMKSDYRDPLCAPLYTFDPMTPKSLAVSCEMGRRAFSAPLADMGRSERKDKEEEKQWQWREMRKDGSNQDVEKKGRV